MRFVWFWTFWFWSKESFRDGLLLRSPLQGVGSHWDEWFRHEASEQDRNAIETAGRNKATQRQFIAWLLRHWPSETGRDKKRMVSRFVLSELAHIPPFNQWAAFEKYRASYGVKGISALVLSAASAGEPDDVRAVEGLALPADPGGKTVVSEGFQVDTSELETARSAAKTLLQGKGLPIFLTKWILCGRRPYPQWFSNVLVAGWIFVAAIILFLVAGPEPGRNLVLLSASLVTLWGGLVTAAAAVIFVQTFRAWRTGAALAAQLEQSQIRLRMNGGLTLKGGSAGLPFCLNVLLALYHAEPGAVHGSCIWRRFFCRMHSQAESWAGTGIIRANGAISPVVMEPKMRACLKHEEIRDVVAPRQREASKRTVENLLKHSSAVVKESPAGAFAGTARVGFAAEKPQLRVHACRNIAQAMMTLGQFMDRRQIFANAFALAVSAVMLNAIPDLRSILLSHPAPAVVEPISPSPYYLWVSLDTKHPEYFSLVLESSYWSNRRVDVKRQGGLTPSVRGEIQRHRLIARTPVNEDDGIVWIERRRRFLSREFLPGERVGRYSIKYLERLGREQIFNFKTARRKTMIMTWSCTFRWLRALAGLGLLFWNVGCADRGPVRVQLHARTPSTPGALHLEITAQVAGRQNGLTYKWFSVAGACDPQESDKPTTLFKFADGAARDRVSVEVWRDGLLLAQNNINVKLDEIQAQLAAQQRVPEDLRIEITTVLPYEPKGGPDTHSNIAGTVGGKLSPGYSVVLYARASDVSYIQPMAYASRPIRPDNTWTSWTHTGSSYAALLVRPGFEPVPRLDVLPKVGGYVLARTIIDGAKK
jgi:hypothetical protein